MLSDLSGASDLASVQPARFFQQETGSIRYATAIHGLDMGAEINALYDNLPATGGEIVVQESASFATPILFGTNGKPALLVGLPGDIITLTYTGSGGTAVTFDYGTGHRMGHGLRDLTLTGPGHSTDTIGVVFGGVNGAEGLDFRDFKIVQLNYVLKNAIFSSLSTLTFKNLLSTNSCLFPDLAAGHLPFI